MQRFQEREELAPLARLEGLESGRHVNGLAPMQSDRFFERGGPAIVEVRPRVGDTPERRRPPLAGRLLTPFRLAVGNRHRRHAGPGIADGGFEIRAHVVQEQVGIEPRDRAEGFGVAVGAADGPENGPARSGFAGELGCLGQDLERRRQTADEVSHQAALLIGQIDAFGPVPGIGQWGRLGTAGVRQTELVGTGRLDEIAQGRELQLPAEPADAAVAEPRSRPRTLESRAALKPTSRAVVECPRSWLMIASSGIASINPSPNRAGVFRCVISTPGTRRRARPVNTDKGSDGWRGRLA